MKKKHLLIAVLLLAMSTMVYAQDDPLPFPHEPLLDGDSDSCPPAQDDWGDPLPTALSAMPKFNQSEVGKPINWAPVAGVLDFCGFADMIFCSLGALEDLLDDLAYLGPMLQCINLDINGPLDLDADIPVTPNGIPDALYELGLLQALYNQGDPEVMAAFQGNFTVLKDLIIDALVEGGFIAAAGGLPNLIPSLAGILGGFATLGDADTNAALDTLLLLLSDIGLEPPEGGIQAITEAIPALGPNGDYDGDGATNAQEYGYFVNFLEYSPDEYIAAIMDPDQVPPNPLELNVSPAGKRVPLGAEVVFSVSVKPGQGSAVGYQWFKDGGILDDETGSQLVIPNAQVSDSGVYRVDVDIEAKDVAQYSITYTLIVADMAVPVGSALGLVALAGACAMAGVAGLRRRK